MPVSANACIQRDDDQRPQVRGRRLNQSLLFLGRNAAVASKIFLIQLDDGYAAAPERSRGEVLARDRPVQDASKIAHRPIDARF